MHAPQVATGVGGADGYGLTFGTGRHRGIRVAEQQPAPEGVARDEAREGRIGNGHERPAFPVPVTWPAARPTAGLTPGRLDE
jgi:hypothetical protein